VFGAKKPSVAENGPVNIKKKPIVVEEDVNVNIN